MEEEDGTSGDTVSQPGENSLILQAAFHTKSQGFVPQQRKRGA